MEKAMMWFFVLVAHAMGTDTDIDAMFETLHGDDDENHEMGSVCRCSEADDTCNNNPEYTWKIAEIGVTTAQSALFEAGETCKIICARDPQCKGLELGLDQGYVNCEYWIGDIAHANSFAATSDKAFQCIKKNATIGLETKIFHNARFKIAGRQVSEIDNHTESIDWTSLNNVFENIPQFNSTNDPSQTTLGEFGQTTLNKDDFDAHICASQDTDQVDLVFVLSLKDDKDARLSKYVSRLMAPYMVVSKTAVGYNKYYTLLKPMFEALEKVFSDWDENWIVEFDADNGVQTREIEQSEFTCQDHTIWTLEYLGPPPAPTPAPTGGSASSQEADSTYERQRGQLAASLFGLVLMQL